MLQKRALMERRWQEAGGGGGGEVKWVKQLGLSLSNYYCYELLMYNKDLHLKHLV